jgi:hypothetical protein
MKKNIFLLMLFVTIFLQAQEHNDRPKIKEMHAQKWEYIVEKARLTTQEAEKAQPIFMEYEQSVWKLMEKNRPFFMNHKNKGENAKPNFKEMNDSYINIEIQKAHILKLYYQKLEKVVSAETIFKMGGAERSFRKDLVKDWQGKHKQRKD